MGAQIWSGAITTCLLFIPSRHSLATATGAARVLYCSPADGATQSDSNYTGYANATEFEIG